MSLKLFSVEKWSLFCDEHACFLMLRLYKPRNKSVLSKNFSAKLSHPMKLLSRKYKSKISVNYFYFDLNFHSRAYRKTWHPISGFLLISFLYLSTFWLIPKPIIYAQTLTKRHSHKKNQSTQFSTANISKYGFYSYNNAYWKNAIWTT